MTQRSKKASIGHRVEHRLLRGLLGLIRSMPLPAVRGIARRLGIFLFRVARVRRSVVIAQLRAAFPTKPPDEIERIALRSYVNICTTFLELFWSPNFALPQYLRECRLMNVEVMLDAVARGRGVILISGHYGNWEWIPHAMQAQTGLTGAAIIRPMNNLLVDAEIQACRTQYGGQVIPMERAGLEGYRLLKRGGILMLLADQNAPRDAVFVSFLGRLATVFRGPALLGLKTGAPFILVSSHRDADGRYEIRYSEIPTDHLPEDPDAAIDELSYRHVKALEAVIREEPGDWFWHHRRWKHVPDATSRVVPDRMA
jgi:Kdo2-lipid IVA lauroyltransferase/acyltransferase